MRLGGEVSGQDAIAELTQARTQVAKHERLAAGDQFNTTGVASVSAAHGKGQFLLDEGFDVLGPLKAPAAGGQQRVANLGPNGAVIERRRQLAASTPKAG